MPGRDSRVCGDGGGFDVPVVLGSRSTDLRGRFGGCAGRAVDAGDRLHYTSAAVHPRVRELPDACRRTRQGGVHAAAGDARAGAGASRGSCVRPRWVADRSDLAPIRSHGVSARRQHRRGPTASMISTPTTMGLVQVPPSGEPILLMADRQTTGGYAAIAVVIAADLPLAGQLGPGHGVTFEACTPERRAPGAEAEGSAIDRSRPPMTGSVADVERQLSIAFGGGRVRVHVPLAPLPRSK